MAKQTDLRYTDDEKLALAHTGPRLPSMIDDADFLIIGYERLCFMVADPRSTIEDVQFYGSLRAAILDRIKEGEADKRHCEIVTPGAASP